MGFETRRRWRLKEREETEENFKGRDLEESLVVLDNEMAAAGERNLERVKEVAAIVKKINGNGERNEGKRLKKRVTGGVWPLRALLGYGFEGRKEQCQVRVN